MLGLVITGFGVVAATSDLVGLAVSVIGLVVLAMASQEACRPDFTRCERSHRRLKTFKQRRMQSGYTVENWFLQQSTLVPTNDPNDWILPAPGPQTWDSANPYGPHGDGTPLPEHPAKVGTPQPATMTSHIVFAGMAAILTLVVGGILVTTMKQRLE